MLFIRLRFICILPLLVYRYSEKCQPCLVGEPVFSDIDRSLCSLLESG